MASQLKTSEFSIILKGDCQLNRVIFDLGQDSNAKSERAPFIHSATASN